MVKNWVEYNESISLSDTEKEFLWVKMETKKKAKAKESESDIYSMLNKDMDISEDGFIKILNSLEYSMKKRIKTGDAPKGKYTDVFNSLKSKLPDSWVGVKFSNLKAHRKKED